MDDHVVHRGTSGIAPSADIRDLQDRLPNIYFARTPKPSGRPQASGSSMPGFPDPDDDEWRKNGTPKNNQKQNEQTTKAAEQTGLSKEGQDLLHREVGHKNYSWAEILEVAESIAKYLGGKFIK